MKKTKLNGKNATPICPANQSGAGTLEMASKTAGQQQEAALDVWQLRLYVAGKTSRSLTAHANLKKLCEAYLPGRYSLEVIDLLENPSHAREHHIIAVPTLIRIVPEPTRRIIGDLSQTQKVLDSLDLDLSSVSTTHQKPGVN